MVATLVLLACTLALLGWLWSRLQPTYLRPTGKAVFISGCDSGIGHRLALHCLELGFTVFAGCLQPDGPGARDLRQLADGQITVVPLNVTQQDSVERAAYLVDEALRSSKGSKGLWALVNNAGVIVCGEFDWLTKGQCQQQIDVNLAGTIFVTKAFLPLILRQKGRVVTMTSVNGACAYPGLAVYCATKFGLEGFSDSLRLELREYGVHVAVVQPGDFARLTRIMSGHEQHVKDMWRAMSAEKRELYADHFWAYHRKVLQNYGVTSPASFEHSTLLQDVQHALLAAFPRARYVSAPFSFRVFFAVIRHVPTNWGDAVLRLLFSLVFRADNTTTEPTALSPPLDE